MYLILRDKTYSIYQCPNDEAVANFTRAVNRGDISWHAGPMNMQPELMTPSLFEFGIDLSLSLDARFNITRKFRTLSQRDVPGNIVYVVR